MKISSDQRVVRSDKGRITFTPRDLFVQTWCGEQYAIRLDQLKRLLGQDAQRPTQEPGKVGTSTAQRVVRRWVTAGVVQSKYLIAREPPWIFLTSKGLRELQLPFRPYTPTVAMANHHYWINQVRLWVEQQYPADRWVSERWLLKEREGTAANPLHVVDGEIHRSGIDDDETIIAVEVELTIKGAQRSRRIMQELAERYDGIWYFTNAITHDAVCRTINSLSEEVRKLFRVRDLTQTH